jgi:pimeloyl-ACP methyl ester carboxylesterase
MAGPSIVRATFKNGLSRTTLSKSDLKYYTSSLLDGSHHAIFYFFSQTGHPLPDYSHVLRSLTMPVTVIWGTKDNMLVWKDQSDKVMHDLKLQKSDIHLIEESNHFVPEEASDQIVDIIANF